MTSDFERPSGHSAGFEPLSLLPASPTRVFGVDFTSRPTSRKPITCAHCLLENQVLHCERVESFGTFEAFEGWLESPGPWVAGFDFPFGQSRRFIDNIGWPACWRDYVRFVSTLTRAEFRQALDDYRAPRPAGDKEHRRSMDSLTGAISPQKLYGVPVGLMFFEGAPRLLQSGVHLPGLVDGDAARIAVEAYPGVLARRVTRSGYKSDTLAKQTESQAQARQALVDWLGSDVCRRTYGVTVEFDRRLKDDPTGDSLDAVLCAVQASWARRNAGDIAARLTADHRLEGWIADPRAFSLS